MERMGPARPAEVYKFCAEMFDKELGKRRRREELIHDLQQQLQESEEEKMLLKQELQEAEIRLEARAPSTELREVRQQLEQAHQEIDVNEQQVQARDQEIAQLKERLRAASLLSNTSGGSNVVPTPKPVVFKGTKFDGQAKNLRRFLNRLENEFELYGSNFPTDAIKVAYAISGLDDKPSEWAQQFYDFDPDNVRHNWNAFRQRMTEQFEDPDLASNTQRELLQLRQRGSLSDFVTEFENLCARINWPRSVWASTFLQGLAPALQRKIRESDIDITNYSAVKLKAVRLQNEYDRFPKARNDMTRFTAPRRNLSNTVANDDRRTSTAPRTEMRSCFHCGQKGHISAYCPEKQKKDSMELKSLEMLAISEPKNSEA